MNFSVSSHVYGSYFRFSVLFSLPLLVCHPFGAISVWVLFCFEGGGDFEYGLTKKRKKTKKNTYLQAIRNTQMFMSVPPMHHIICEQISFHLHDGLIFHRFGCGCSVGCGFRNSVQCDSIWECNDKFSSSHLFSRRFAWAQQLQKTNRCGVVPFRINLITITTCEYYS